MWKRADVVLHVMDKSNWAALRKRKRREPDQHSPKANVDLVLDNAGAHAKKAKTTGAPSLIRAISDGVNRLKNAILGSSEKEPEVEKRKPDATVVKNVKKPKKPKPPSSSSRAIARVKERFKIPVPGKDGAVPNLSCGTNVRPDRRISRSRGRSGLKLGKARMKGLIEKFGGRVTSSVSEKRLSSSSESNPGSQRSLKPETDPSVNFSI